SRANPSPRSGDACERRRKRSTNSAVYRPEPEYRRLRRDQGRELFARRAAHTGACRQNHKKGIGAQSSAPPFTCWTAQRRKRRAARRRYRKGTRRLKTQTVKRMTSRECTTPKKNPIIAPQSHPFQYRLARSWSRVSE